jgi:hypothetical protein
MKPRLGLTLHKGSVRRFLESIPANQRILKVSNSRIHDFSSETGVNK